MKRFQTLGFACAASLLFVGLDVVASYAGEPAGEAEPQYLTAPIHAPRHVQSLINGRLTFAAAKKPGGGGGGGQASQPALFDLPAQTSTEPVNAVSRLDSYQGETAIAAYAGRFVGGFNSIFPGACSEAAANCAPGVTTSDDGLNWTTANLPINGNLMGFDPSVAADASGTFYYGYAVCAGGCSTGNLMVATSSDAASWIARVVTPPQGGVFDDKPWVAADPGLAGTAYLVWTRNKGNNQTLLASTTLDGGSTWSAPVKINDGNSRFERVLYGMPASDPTTAGKVYTVWMDYARKALFVDKSANYGATWGADVKAASLSVTFKDIGCNGGRSMTPSPYIAVDGNGWVYVVYANETGSTGMDVYLVYSRDGGAHWLGPYRLNDATAGHQYNPALSVVGTVVHASWLDRRDDAASCLTHTYSTASTGIFEGDGRPHFSANRRVTNSPSNFNGNPNGPGDYTGSVAYVSEGSAAAMLFFPTHLATDIAAETGAAGGFEGYVSAVMP